MERQIISDRFDRMLEKWHASRPEVDFSSFEVGTRILRAAHYLQARLDRTAAGYGLAHQGDLDVLTQLDLVGPQSPSMLARDLLLTTGGMTVRLNRLQDAGLIERKPNPDDGRGVHVHLTSRGRALAQDALVALEEVHRAITASLQPSDSKQVNGLLRALLSALGDVPTFIPSIVVERKPSIPRPKTPGEAAPLGQIDPGSTATS